MVIDSGLVTGSLSVSGSYNQSGNAIVSGSVTITGNLTLPSLAQGTTETNVLVAGTNGLLKYRTNLSLQGTQGTQGT